MSHKIHNAASRSLGFARENPVVASLLLIVISVAVAIVVVAAFWAQLDSIRFPRIVSYTIGWFVATATTLGMALFLMWVNDRREVDRSRRAMRLNFDHAIMAMLDLAQKFTVGPDRNVVGPGDRVRAKANHRRERAPETFRKQVDGVSADRA